MSAGIIAGDAVPELAVVGLTFLFALLVAAVAWVFGGVPRRSGAPTSRARSPVGEVVAIAGIGAALVALFGVSFTLLLRPLLLRDAYPAGPPPGPHWDPNDWIPLQNIPLWSIALALGGSLLSWRAAALGARDVARWGAFLGYIAPVWFVSWFEVLVHLECC